MTLPALGAGLLISAAAGMHMGESAIDLIDPIHFQGPAIHPKDRGAAIDPDAVAAPREPAFASLYGWEEGRAAREADCGGCDALAARDVYYRPEPVPDYPTSGYPIEEAVFEEEPPTYPVEWKDKVERYAYYEIEAAPEGAGGPDDAYIEYYEE